MYCYNKADWDSIHEELTYLSENYFRLKEDAPRNVEQIVISSMKVFHKLYRYYIPTKQIITDLPWMTCKLEYHAVILPWQKKLSIVLDILGYCI